MTPVQLTELLASAAGQVIAIVALVRGFKTARRLHGHLVEHSLKAARAAQQSHMRSPGHS